MTRRLLTVLALSGITPSLAGAAIIYGNVRNEAGEPIAGAQVTITSDLLQDGPRRASTGADGYYLVGELPAGTYHVLAEKLGVREGAEEDVALSADDTHALTLVLGAAKEARAPAPAPAPVASAPAADKTPAAAPPAASPAPAPPSSAAAATEAPAPRARGSYKPKRRTIAGTIVVVDARAITVAVGMGREVRVVYDKETEIEGELAVGKNVRIIAPVESGSYRRAQSIKVRD